MLRTALAAYQTALAAHPLRTNLCTAVPMMVAGDMCAQQLEPERTELDYQRTLVMAAYSGAVFTPLFFYLYRVQERFITGSPVAVAAQKALCSVFVGGLPANICFLSLATAVEMHVFGKKPASGQTCGQVVNHKITNDLPRIMLGSLTFWGPINFCNFMFTPVSYRVVVVSFSAVIWNCYLSVVQHEYVRAAPPVSEPKR
jgi:hypothetical protein